MTERLARLEALVRLQRDEARSALYQSWAKQRDPRADAATIVTAQIEQQRLVRHLDVIEAALSD